MRTRELKPSFFANDALAALPAHARLLYQGLWLMADREGRLRDVVKTIDGEIFPHERVNTSRLLGLLAAAGFIERYVVDGRRYIWIPTFRKHQHVHPNERPSDLPPFPFDVTTDLLQLPESAPESVAPITRPNRASTSSSPSLLALQPSKPSSSLARKVAAFSGDRASKSVDDAFLEEQQALHPLLDVRTEWEKAEDWLRENGRRKRDYRAFLRNWLRRAEEHVGARQPSRNGLATHQGPTDADLAYLSRLGIGQREVVDLDT